MRLSKIIPVLLLAGCTSDGGSPAPADLAPPPADNDLAMSSPADMTMSISPDLAMSISPDFAVIPDLAAPRDGGIVAPRPIGTATFSAGNQCPPNSPIPTSQCLHVVIKSCPGVADFQGELKISEPNGKVMGTVVLGTGGGGGSYYELTFGQPAITNVIQPLLAAGFRVIQRSWPGQDGWLMGPGGTSRLACRYATLLDAIHTNYQSPNTPLCISGNSGGSSEIGYVMAHYGMERIVDLAVPTSGPPHGRLDYGCLGSNDQAWLQACNGVKTCGNSCYFVGPAPGLIDESYGLGTTHCQSKDAAWAATFRDDSVWSTFASLDYPRTEMRFIYGGGDCSEAVPLGRVYANAVVSAKTITIVPNVQHALPAETAGAMQVYNDMIAGCKLRH